MASGQLTVPVGYTKIPSCYLVIFTFVLVVLTFFVIRSFISSYNLMLECKHIILASFFNL